MIRRRHWRIHHRSVMEASVTPINPDHGRSSRFYTQCYVVHTVFGRQRDDRRTQQRRLTSTLGISCSRNPRRHERTTWQWNGPSWCTRDTRNGHLKPRGSFHFPVPCRLEILVSLCACHVAFGQKITFLLHKTSDFFNDFISSSLLALIRIFLIQFVFIPFLISAICNYFICTSVQV